MAATTMAKLAANQKAARMVPGSVTAINLGFINNNGIDNPAVANDTAIAFLTNAIYLLNAPLLLILSRSGVVLATRSA